MWSILIKMFGVFIKVVKVRDFVCKESSVEKCVQSFSFCFILVFFFFGERFRFYMTMVDARQHKHGYWSTVPVSLK